MAVLYRPFTFFVIFAVLGLVSGELRACFLVGLVSIPLVLLLMAGDYIQIFAGIRRMKSKQHLYRTGLIDPEDYRSFSEKANLP